MESSVLLYSLLVFITVVLCTGIVTGKNEVSLCPPSLGAQLGHVAEGTS